MNKTPNSTQNGFSLVEILVATVVLTVGLLAMAASTNYVSAQLRSTTFDTHRSAAKEQIVEELRATPFASIQNQVTPRPVGRYSVTWTVAAPTGNVRQVTITTSGPAYRAGQG